MSHTIAHLRGIHVLRTPAALTAAAALLAGLAACSSGDSDSDGETPQDRLAAAREVIDEAQSLELSLHTDDLPSGVDGVRGADGVGNHEPAFEGTIEISAAGLSGEADVIARDDTVWAQLPFTSAYIEVDPATYNAPDPAALLAVDGGLSSLLTEVTGVTETGERRDGDVVLTELSGVIDGAVVAELFPTADPSGTFDASFELTEGSEMARATITGPFYADAEEVTYEIEIDARDEAVEITRP
jgi:lipoprotein LprG